MIKGDNYKERMNYQLEEWVKGNSIHNDVDEECTPNFSCCNPVLNTPIEDRQLFQQAKNQGKEEVVMNMLGGFLGDMIEAHYGDKSKKIHISDGTNHLKESN